MQQTKKGFTLIELLVVIAIIGILSAIGLVSLNGARERARDAKRKSDLSQLSTALALYYDDQTTPAYPTQTTASLVGEGVLSGSTFVGKYTNALPTTPSNPATNNDYWYITNAAGTIDGVSYNADQVFGLATKLEGGTKKWYVINAAGFGGEEKGSLGTPATYTVSSGTPDTIASIKCDNATTAGTLSACKTTVTQQ